MASTSYQNNIRSTTIGGYQFGFDARTEWSSITRKNNTITINGLRTRMRVNSGSNGIWFSGYSVSVHTDVPSGTRKRNSGLGSGTFNRGSSYLGSAGNYSINVGSTATSITSRSGVSVNGGTGWTSSQSISIPKLGVPTGTTAVDSSKTTKNSISVRNNTTSWGANATSGSVRSYISPNSNFSGQTYIGTSDNALVTHTGLSPNTRYYFRGWSQNGGGRSAYHGTTNGVTLSEVYDDGTINIEAISYTVTGARAYQGALTTTSKIQYRKKGETTWKDSSTATGDNFDITISGLLPGATYERRFVCTTSAGTTTNPIQEFATPTGGTIIHPDGTVQAAALHVVYPDGTVKDAQITPFKGRYGN